MLQFHLRQPLQVADEAIMEDSYRTDFLVAQPSFASGVARLFDLFGTFDAYNGSRSPSEADARAANNDWNVALQDFRAVVDAARVKMRDDETR